MTGPIRKASDCPTIKRREGDELVCQGCGLRWAVSEDAPICLIDDKDRPRNGHHVR